VRCRPGEVKKESQYDIIKLSAFEKTVEAVRFEMNDCTVGVWN